MADADIPPALESASALGLSGPTLIAYLLAHLEARVQVLTLAHTRAERSIND